MLYPEQQINTSKLVRLDQLCVILLLMFSCSFGLKAQRLTVERFLILQEQVVQPDIKDLVKSSLRQNITIEGYENILSSEKRPVTLMDRQLPFPVSQTEISFLEKSKTQKKTAWILLGVGTAMAAVGVIGFSSSWDEGSYSKTDSMGYLLLGGVAVDLVSIPFFISSGVNARKGRK